MSAKFCTNCGTALAPEAKFCGECGTPVGAAPAVAPAVDRIAGERRQVTVLFADLTGFTKLSRDLGAEETHALLNRYFETVDGIVENYGGTIDKHIGDAVMAVFGAPTAHDDDPLRAVRAALDIQQSMAALSQAVGREMQTHIGIASGVVVASGTGSGSHTEYTVTGDSVNLASRLDDLARPGEILISNQVRRTVEGQVDCEPVGELEVRGIDNPVKVCRVRALKDDQQRSNHRAFVGRDSELRQFTAIIDSCAGTGNGQAVLLRGEAGIGKSRLVEEFTDIALAKGFAGHKGLVLDFGAGKGRDAVGALMRSLLGIPFGSGKDVRRAAVEAAISDDLATIDQRIFLNAFLDLPQSAEDRVLFDAMDNVTRTERRHAVLVNLIMAMSVRQPLLITIEDVHWADSIVLDYLASMTATVGDCPTLLVMTSRIDGDPLDQSWRSAAGGASLMTIDLGPLREAEANSMASGFVDSNSRFVRNCIAQADGNPLFLEQLLQGVEDTEEESVPGSIQSLILARMDRTDAADREALQAASVFGQRFSLDALRHLIGDPGYDCAGLIERQLVRREGQDYLFAHAMVREGVYSSLLDAKKREIHDRAAEWFRDVDPVLRADHLGRAENPEAVNAYLEAAAMETEQFRFKRALQLIGRGREIATDDGDVFRLLMLEGACQSDIGNPAEAVDVYRQAQKVATDDIGRCHAWIGLASGMRLVDDYEHALTALDLAEPVARDNHMHRELSQVHYYRGSIFFPLGNLEGGLEQHGLALDHARRAGEADEEAQALSGLGDANYMRGYMITAFGFYDQCIELSRRHGFGRIEIANLTLRADTNLYQNRLQIAYDECMVAVSAAARVGHHRAEIIARCGGLGWIGIETGDLADTRHELELALDQARKVGAGRFQAMALVFLAKILVLEGNWARATSSAEEAVSISRDAGITFTGPMALGALAVCRADPEARARALNEAEEILRDNCVSHNYFYLYRDGMEIHLHTGEWDRVEYFARALEDYTSGEPLPWTDFFIARARALAAHGQGNGVAAELTRLRDEAVDVGFATALPALERAVAGEPMASVRSALLPMFQLNS